MEKSKLQETLEKTRNQNTQYITKNLNEKPIEPGNYTVSIENIKTFIPIRLYFDGENWNEKDLKAALALANNDITKIVYYNRDSANKIKNKI